MRYAVLVGSMALLARRSFGLISVVSRPASVYRSPASSLMGSRSVRLLASIQSPSKSDESEPKFHSKFKSTAEAKLFSSLGNSMKPELLTSVAKLGYAKMTDVQAAVLPHALAGRDVLGQAATGSGKTAVFGLAALQQLDLSPGARGNSQPQVLVVSPTRELATQLVGQIRLLGASLEGVRVVPVIGGANSRDQRSALSGGVHVVVGTPGRLAAHLDAGYLDAARVQTLVLDEADTLLDLGFEEEVHRVLKYLPKAGKRQTMLFSATWSDRVETLAKFVTKNPEVVKATGVENGDDSSEIEAGPELLQQTAVLYANPADRDEVLLSVLAERRGARHQSIPLLATQKVDATDDASETCIVFCETKLRCAEVAQILSQEGAGALPLHGDLEQSDRERVLARFKNGSCRVLVATNVAARGLDMAGVGFVISDSPPGDPATHVHRVGRTARAGAPGMAVTMVCTHGARDTGLPTSSGSTGSSSSRSSGDSGTHNGVDDKSADDSDIEMERSFTESALLPEVDDDDDYVARNAKRPPSTSSFSSQFASSSKDLGRLNAIDSVGGAPIPRVEWLAHSSSNNALSSNRNSMSRGQPNSSEGGGGGQKLSKWASEWATIVITGGRKDKLRPGDLLGALTAGAAGKAASSSTTSKKSSGDGGRSGAYKKPAKGAVSSGASKKSSSSSSPSSSGGGAGLKGVDVGKIEVMETKTFVAVRQSAAKETVARLNDVKIKNQKFRVHLVKWLRGLAARSILT